MIIISQGVLAVILEAPLEVTTAMPCTPHSEPYDRNSHMIFGHTVCGTTVWHPSCLQPHGIYHIVELLCNENAFKICFLELQPLR